jgi:hypothetical protein
VVLRKAPHWLLLLVLLACRGPAVLLHCSSQTEAVQGLQCINRAGSAWQQGGQQYLSAGR